MGFTYFIIISTLLDGSHCKRGKLQFSWYPKEDHYANILFIKKLSK
jgi:hypothetical protein